MDRLIKSSRVMMSRIIIGIRTAFGRLPIGRPLENLHVDGYRNGKLHLTQKFYVVQTNTKIVQRCILMSTDPGDLVLDPDLRLRHHGLCRRAVGPALDHHRHLPRRPGVGAGARHGRALSLVPARRQPRGAAEGGRDHAARALRDAYRRRHPPGLRLRARAPHHPEIHRQQCRDRRDLGHVAGDPGAAPRPAQRRPRQTVGGVGNPARGRRGLAR